jgi:plasmid maintenance system killer protein
MSAVSLTLTYATALAMSVISLFGFSWWTEGFIDFTKMGWVGIAVKDLVFAPFAGYVLIFLGLALPLAKKFRNDELDSTFTAYSSAIKKRYVLLFLAVLIFISCQALNGWMFYTKFNLENCQQIFDNEIKINRIDDLTEPSQMLAYCAERFRHFQQNMNQITSIGVLYFAMSFRWEGNNNEV